MQRSLAGFLSQLVFCMLMICGHLTVLKAGKSEFWICEISMVSGSQSCLYFCSSFCLVASCSVAKIASAVVIRKRAPVVFRAHYFSHGFVLLIYIQPFETC